LLVASVQWPVTSKAFNRKDRRVGKDVKPHREKLEPDFLGSLGGKAFDLTGYRRLTTGH
jgi:hypothetical protein